MVSKAHNVRALYTRGVNPVHPTRNSLRLRDSANGRGNAVARDQHICLVHGASAAKRHPAEARCLPKVYSKSGAEIVHAH